MTRLQIALLALALPIGLVACGDAEAPADPEVEEAAVEEEAPASSMDDLMSDEGDDTLAPEDTLAE